MANRRMISMQIVDTDAFLEMPVSSQLLYFHLLMRADDEGFIANPKRIMKMIGIQEDDLKIITAKRFILPFESGVVVIKHWLIHNTIRMDRFTPTKYESEKNSIIVKENKAYTEMATNRIPDGNQMAHKISKVKISKENIIPEKISGEVKLEPEQNIQISELIKSFEGCNPSANEFYKRKTERTACENLIKIYGYDRTKIVIEKTLPRTNNENFFPTIIKPTQLFEKWSSLESAIIRYKNKGLDKQRPVFI